MQHALIHHLNSVPDPRAENRVTHYFIDIIMVAICAVLAGAVGWQDMTDFGIAKEEWLKTFLRLPDGIPSPDTFARVFSLLDPAVFEQRFATWMRSVQTVTHGQVIAVDGKTAIGSGFGDSRALHLVSAFATANDLVLGQVATDQKSNEITAIPKLLELLDLKGCIVTTDALGCQADIAADIVDRGGDYLLAIKGNQGHLHKDIITLFADPTVERLTHAAEERGHGRIEKRTCEVMSGEPVITRLRHKNNWVKLSTIVKVTSERTIQKTGLTSTQARYYISSVPSPTAAHMQGAIRSHWRIENNLHWVVDTALGEDANRIHTDHAPENLAILRHIALNLVRNDTTRKTGVEASLRRAGWDTNYLAKLIGVRT